MRLGACSIKNFGSYASLNFDFRGNGLSLVHGATGSGKSTFQDIAAWILYGVTAKNGAADDVRSWTASKEPTIGVLEVDLSDGTIIEVARIRGGSSGNDLFWEELSRRGDKHRGKDMADTQKQLNLRLGVDADLYCTASCFNEFSDAGLFFLAKAKDRRAVFERIADLSLSIKLAERTTNERKRLKAFIAAAQEGISATRTRIETTVRLLTSTKAAAATWGNNQDNLLRELQSKEKSFTLEKNSKIAALETKSFRFEAERDKKIDEFIDKIDALDEKIVPPAEFEVRVHQAEEKMSRIVDSCPTCKRPNDRKDEIGVILEEKAKNDYLIEKRMQLVDRLKETQAARNPYAEQLEQAKVLTNHHKDRLLEEQQKENPFTAQSVRLKVEISSHEASLAEQLVKLEALDTALGHVLMLSDLAGGLRGVLLAQAVASAEQITNEYLERFFDSEFRVSFILAASSDDLNIDIFKNGHSCSYYQLSKGQRQILRLCFVLAIMRLAANEAGVHFSTLFFDEALDGLDSGLKLKAFALFQELEKEHESIFVIDHDERLKSMFLRSFGVQLDGDNSIIADSNGALNEDEGTLVEQSNYSEGTQPT